MGYHYLQPGLTGDTVVDPTMPEILVYVPTKNGDLELGAVEWFVADHEQDLGTDADRPTLFDRLPFDGPMPGRDPGMPVHNDLHVGLYDYNPAGQLAPFNPKVTCPPNELSAPDGTHLARQPGVPGWAGRSNPPAHPCLRQCHAGQGPDRWNRR